MKKFLLTLIVTMLTCLGAWATDDVVLDFGTGSTWTINYSGGDAVTGVTINVATEGDLASIQSGINWSYASPTYNLDNIKGKSLIVTGSLNSADVSTLTYAQDPLWNGFCQASTMSIADATISDDDIEKIKTAWKNEHSQTLTGLTLPGETPSDPPVDNRTIVVKHGDEIIGDEINVPFGSDYQFTVKAENFNASYLETHDVSVLDQSVCQVSYDFNNTNIIYTPGTVTVSPQACGQTVITITLKEPGGTNKIKTLAVKVYDPNVASSFSIYPASPITVDKGNTTDVEVRIEPTSATFGLSTVTGLAGVTAEIVEIAGKKYIRINASEATETGTATFILSPNGLEPMEVTVNVVAPRVPVTASCPEVVRFGQNDLSASAILGVDESEKDNYTVSYSSKNSDILDVNAETGVLSPVSLGNATITVTVTPKSSDAEYAEFTQDFPVSVEKGQYTFTAAADPAFFVVGEDGTSTLSYSNVQLNGVDATTGFEVSYSPKEAKDGVSLYGNTVTVASSATAGTFTAIATLTPDNTTNYEVATAEVDITIGTPQITLNYGDQIVDKSIGANTLNGYLKFTPEADFLDNTTFEFSAKSDDPSIVTVAWDPTSTNQYTNSIIFTPISCGETYVTLTIKAKNNNSGKSTMGSERIKVTVINPLKFTLADGNLKVNYDKPLTLDAIKSTVTKVYTGYDDNPTIVTSGYEIEVYNGDVKVTEDIPAEHTEGYTFTIKVKATNSEYSDALESKTKTVEITHLQSFDLALNGGNVTIMDNGQTATITPVATYTSDPEDATTTIPVEIPSYDVTYTLSADGVATVVPNADNTITVTGQAPGTVTVTVTAHPAQVGGVDVYATITNTTTITVKESQRVYLTTETDADGKTYVVVNVPEGGAFGGISDEPRLDDEKCTASLTDLKNAENIKIVGYVSNSDMQEFSNLVGGYDSKVKVLDMGGATMTERITTDPNVTEVANVSFIQPNYRSSNTNQLYNLDKLVLPKPATDVDYGTILPAKFGRRWIGDKKRSSFELVITDGWTEIGAGAFEGMSVSNLSMPSSLIAIRESAFSGHVAKQLFFPPNIDILERASFENGTSALEDVFFSGRTAPTIVDTDAFSSATQCANNAVDKSQATAEGTITRNAYKSGSNYTCMMHYPGGLTKEELATYVDPKRVYDATERTKMVGDKSGNGCAYSPWTDEFWEVIKDAGKGSYSFANLQVYDGKIEAAYLDPVFGTVLTWPSQEQQVASYAIAGSGYHWDGTPFNAEEMARQGIYQFVLARGDASPDNHDYIFERDYTAGLWWSICVPFNMPVEDIKKVFGDDTKVVRFSKVIRDADAEEKYLRLEFTNSVMGDNNTLSTGNHDGSTGILAHRPYMIKPSLDLAGVNPEESDYACIENGVLRRVYPNYDWVTGALIAEDVVAVDKNGTSTGITYTFKGNHSETNGQGDPVLMPQYSYFLSALKDTPNDHQFFFQMGEKGRFHAHTAIVLTDNGAQDYEDFFTQTSGAPIFKSVFGDVEDDATDIEKVELVFGNEKFTENVKVYTINGQLVNGSNLAPGLYIKNGKKFIVK